ncbi:hypothetical protein PBAL39_15414 [Pedobacter sp. BAL39]|nr:hypothetical protein PBAL39_15414 [Pedobacter sp. BAL39]
MRYFRLIFICFLVSSIISLIGVFILSSLKYIGDSDSDFKNLPYGIAVGVNLYLALGSLPILFNLNERVRSSVIWSAISFFLLPIVFVLLLLLAMWDEPWPGILFCMPYLVILTVLFFLRKKSDR